MKGKLRDWCVAVITKSGGQYSSVWSSYGARNAAQTEYERIVAELRDRQEWITASGVDYSWTVAASEVEAVRLDAEEPAL